MKDSELSKLLEEALESEKGVVKAVCHNYLREELYGEKLQNLVIFHLENFVKNIFDLALLQNLIHYDMMDKIKPNEDNCPKCGTLTKRTIGCFTLDTKTGEFNSTFDCPKCGEFWVYQSSTPKLEAGE